jgi:hypothetical protein
MRIPDENLAEDDEEEIVQSATPVAKDRRAEPVETALR